MNEFKSLKYEIFPGEELIAVVAALEYFITMASLRIENGYENEFDRMHLQGTISVLSRLDPDSVFLKDAKYFKDTK